MLASLRRFSASEITQERLRIINFYQKHGEVATKEAFGVGRKLMYVWKKRLRESQGKLPSLIPQSTAPLTKRQMETHPLVVEHIKVVNPRG